MTTSRKEAEAIMTALATTARKLLGTQITGAFSMDDPKTMVFVTVGGDGVSISPADLGGALERVGLSLQGRAPDDADVTMVKRARDGSHEPLEPHKPFAPHSADVAADADDSGEISGAQMVKMLEISHDGGVHAGKAIGYADVLGTAEQRLKDQEELLTTAPEGSNAASICMGEIMALRSLLDAFSGASDYFAQKRDESTTELRQYVIDQGIIDPDRLKSDEAKRVAAAAMAAPRAAQG
jgi:hypothetical protein